MIGTGLKSCKSIADLRKILWRVDVNLSALKRHSNHRTRRICNERARTLVAAKVEKFRKCRPWEDCRCALGACVGRSGDHLAALCVKGAYELTQVVHIQARLVTSKQKHPLRFR